MDDGDVTLLLQRMAGGDKAAQDRLIPIVYSELRRLAANRMRREQSDHTLQVTALVHEAYMKLAKPSDRQWQGRTHFFAVASKVMRQILVDHARARLAAKRGADITVSNDALLEVSPASPISSERLLALNEALTRLQALDERQCQIVELRFFGGLSVDETADLLKISSRTVKRDWQIARAWLYGELAS